MFNFEYFTPTQVCFGKGTVGRIGEYVKKYNGTKVLIHYGGGSVIDSAKAIGYGLTNKGDVWDFFAHTRTANHCMPLGSILTIAAAGSEMSNSCVITNEDTGEKDPIFNPTPATIF